MSDKQARAIILNNFDLHKPSRGSNVDNWAYGKSAAANQKQMSGSGQSGGLSDGTKLGIFVGVGLLAAGAVAASAVDAQNQADYHMGQADYNYAMAREYGGGQVGGAASKYVPVPDPRVKAYRQQLKGLIAPVTLYAPNNNLQIRQ